MNADQPAHIETVAVHAGRHSDPVTGAVMPPIHLSTTFERNADGSYHDGYVYTRSENPNRRGVEECLAALEGGAAAAAFSSGMAAIAAILQALAPGRPCDLTGRPLSRHAPLCAGAVGAVGAGLFLCGYDGPEVKLCMMASVLCQAQFQEAPRCNFDRLPRSLVRGEDTLNFAPSRDSSAIFILDYIIIK